jgi:hypothetical protein
MDKLVLDCTYFSSLILGDVHEREASANRRSYQGFNTNSFFDQEKNKTVFNIAYKYGFRKNFCANPLTILGGSVAGVIHERSHNDHGHLGLTNLDLEEVTSINVEKI